MVTQSTALISSNLSKKYQWWSNLKVELQLPTQIYMGQMRLLAMKTSSYLNLRMMALVMVWRMMKLSLYLIPETLVVSRSVVDQTLIVVLLTIS